MELGSKLVRGALRRAGYAKERSSYPFLSGDTYRSLSDHKYNPGWGPSKLRVLSFESSRNTLFVSLRDFENFLDQIQALDVSFESTILILHNHDSQPGISEMEFIASKFLKVYCANWVGPKELATPLPLGLENYSYLRNGVPRDYRKMIRKGLPLFESRPIEILGAFSISTNVPERSRAHEFLTSYPGAYVTTEFTSPGRYRDLVADSKYVLSPPGSGTDCHRTWEAIYLGAIPIVLRSAWGFTEGELPVMIVDDWSEVPDQIAISEIRNEASILDLADKYLVPLSDLAG